MWIKIDGTDKCDEISEHYIDNNTKFVHIRFNNGKWYTYYQNRVSIGPIHKKYLGSNDVFVHLNNKITWIKEYMLIGDFIIKVDSNGEENYFKTKDVEIEVVERRPSCEESIGIENKCKPKKIVKKAENYKGTYEKDEDQPHIYEKTDMQPAHVKFCDYISYYKEIAKVKDSKGANVASNYLENQIKEMKINDESVLYSYFLKTTQSVDYKQAIYPFGINLSQRKAIKNAISEKISLIQGPPGTGKTQSILNIIANIIVHGQTMGIVSSNNEAIKNIKEKMEKAGYGFLVALLGKAENKEYFFKNQLDYPEFLNWKQTEEHMQILLQEIGNHEKCLVSLLEEKNLLSKLQHTLSEYEHEFMYFKEYLKSNNVEKLSRFNFFKLNNQQILQLLMELNYLKEDSITLSKKIVYFLRYGIHNFSQFDKKGAILLDVQELYYKGKIHELKEAIKKIEGNLNNNGFDNELKHLVSKSDKYFKGYLEKRYNKSREIFELNTYRSMKIFPKFQKEYPIILSTTHALTKSIKKNCILDYLIVDEASQVELVPGILALSVAKNAVIVGDLKQLPHIPDEQIKQKQYEQWYSKYAIPEEYHYEKHSLLSSFSTIYKDENQNAMLQEHYRCHERIIGFCNKKYYNGQLIHHAKVKSEKPLVLLQTVPGNHMRYGKFAANKITNVREIESLDQEFIDMIGIDKSFGFIAPFRGQVKVSENMLPSDFQKDTVHKFQGRECDVVMFSTVLDKKESSQRFLQFVDDPHLVNVAISRAKEKIILVSDVNVFKKAKGDICDLIRYMEYYEEDSILHHSKVRSVFDLLYSDYNEVLKKKRKKKGWNKSKFDSQNLIAELIESILSENKYNGYKYNQEILIKDIIRDDTLLTLEEKRYVLNHAHIDFLVYSSFNKQPIVAIEVDGYEYHENNPKQLVKDQLKNNILEKYGIPILRFKTNYSGEREKIKSFL